MLRFFDRGDFDYISVAAIAYTCALVQQQHGNVCSGRCVGLGGRLEEANAEGGGES